MASEDSGRYRDVRPFLLVFRTIGLSLLAPHNANEYLRILGSSST